MLHYKLQGFSSYCLAFKYTMKQQTTINNVSFNGSKGSFATIWTDSWMYRTSNNIVSRAGKLHICQVLPAVWLSDRMSRCSSQSSMLLLWFKPNGCHWLQLCCLAGIKDVCCCLVYVVVLLLLHYISVDNQYIHDNEQLMQCEPENTSLTLTFLKETFQVVFNRLSFSSATLHVM